MRKAAAATISSSSSDWREQRPPSSDSDDAASADEDSSAAAASSSGSSAGYESDWEREVTDNGEVFYVAQRVDSSNSPSETLEPGSVSFSSERRSESHEATKKKSGKLSRLVRRRESKRDRIISAPRSSVSHDVSSDNDSSTYYGQLKTFESVFEEENSKSEDNLTLNNGNSLQGIGVEIKEVPLRIKGRKHVDPGVPLIESMMGLIPVRRPYAGSSSTSQPMSPESELLSSSVVVAGFVGNGPASKLPSDQIRVGDLIRMVDGQQVNLSTIEQLLSTYSSSTKVKLTLQRSASTSAAQGLLSSSEATTLGPQPEALFTLMTGAGPTSRELQGLLRRLPYMVLYVTRAGITESSPEGADVIFQFPSSSVTCGQGSQALLEARGLFVTLCQALPEITGPSPGDKPVLTSVVVHGAGLVHVAYAEEREDTLLLALPASKTTAKEVAQLLRDLVRIIRFKHRTLSSAFRSSQHRTELDQLFGLTFLDLLLGIGSDQERSPFDLSSTVISQSAARFSERLPAAQWLRLPEDIKFQVDDAMSQFESADFQDFSDEFYDLPREFDILGSCLFHRGYLLASHLPRDDMVDVFLWCQFKQLLRLTNSSPVHQVVAWKEVHQTSRRLQAMKPNNASASEAASSSAIPDLSTGRTFLLVVGLGHQLLGCLLRTGTPHTSNSSQTGPVRPDPFYVDQAMNTLDHLDEMGIPLVCERWLTLPENPAVLGMDRLYEVVKKEGARKRLDANLLNNVSSKLQQDLPDKGIILRKTKTVDYSSASEDGGQGNPGPGGPARPGSRANDDVNSLHSSSKQSDVSGEEMQTAFRDAPSPAHSRSSEPAPTEDSSVWELHRSGQRHFNTYEAPRGTNNASSSAGGPEDEEEELVTYQVSQLTISPENTLFHYVHLEIGDGIYLSPYSDGSGVLQEELLANFKAACQLIHSTFQTSLKYRESGSRQTPKTPWSNLSLVAAKEQGVLFQWSPRVSKDKTLPLLSYWVCGRLFLDSSPKECYVCYHESAPQLLVELAFRMAFGVHV